ncbi:signal peptidase I [Patescibacteria group bacterium]|nr:signal peptidase I [Patescibacteria group bacterium]
MLKKLSLKLDRKKFLNRITKISVFVWLVCIIGVFAIIGYVVGIRKQLFDSAPTIFVSSLLCLIILGCLAFLVGVISFTAQLIDKKTQKEQNIFIFLIKLFFILAILPLYLLIYIFRPLEIISKLRHGGFRELLKSLQLKQILVKAIALILVGVIILPIWIVGYMTVNALVVNQLGYITDDIKISGTGSMFPTFPKGEGKDPKELAKQIVSTTGMMRYPNGLVIGGKRFFGYEIGRGDIVVVENEKIKEMTKKMYGDTSGWVKRVIGLTGDTIELRGGIVYLNGEPLKEPYTAQPHSTFGETFLSECKKITIPDNSVFVMGDNRKGSGDSREIGFIELNAVSHVFPLKNQKGVLDKTWRDTAKDFDETSKIKLDKEKYLQLLNERRKEAGAKELKYQPKLETSASRRAEVILKFDDFSFEATQSGYTMEQAMREANYSNIVWGEAPIQGYYEAEELIDNQFQFPESKKFLTDKTYQEIGIAEVEGEINGCPTQVIVQHLAGYVPPNYEQTDIDGWKNNLSRLKEIQPGWAELKKSKEFYKKNKQDVDRINEIISTRIANISIIVAKMEANQWLSTTEQKMIDQDKPLFDEQEAIATRLNSR